MPLCGGTLNRVAGRVVGGWSVAASRLQGRGFSSGTDSAVSQALVQGRNRAKPSLVAM